MLIKYQSLSNSIADSKFVFYRDQPLEHKLGLIKALYPRTDDNLQTTTSAMEKTSHTR